MRFYVVDTQAKKGTGMMETIFERFLTHDVKIFKILPKPLIPNQLQLQTLRYLTSLKSDLPLYV